MFGLGRTAKSILRRVNSEWQQSRLRQRDEISFVQAKFLELETFGPDYFFHVLSERKIIFVEVPKVASSYILKELAQLNERPLEKIGNVHKRSGTGLTSPNLLGPEKFLELASDPDLFVFTAVRNPYTRLLSCYLDKFVNVVIGDGSYISNMVLGFSQVAGRKVETGRVMTFAEFIDFACANAPIAFDGHWAQQAKIVPQLLLKPNAIVRFETLASDLADVFRRIGASPEQVARIEAGAKKNTSDKALEFYTPELLDKVADAYAEDFRRFGYPVDDPVLSSLRNPDLQRSAS